MEVLRWTCEEIYNVNDVPEAADERMKITETMGVVHVQITHALFIIAAASMKSDFRYIGCGTSHNECGGRK